MRLLSRLIPIAAALMAMPTLSRDIKRYAPSPPTTPDVADVLMESLGPGTIQRLLSTKLRDLPVYPQDYDAKCDAVTNDQGAYQKAADEAARTNRPLHIGGDGLCLIPSTIRLTKGIQLIGDGEGRSILVGLHNGPIFTWDVNGGDVDKFVASGFTMRGQYAANTDYSLSRGFLIRGDNSAWFQFGRFINLTTEGLYAGFEINKRTFTTNFGEESRTGFITFDNITIRGGNRLAHYGWYFPNGSGTGHTFTNIKTALGDATGAAFRFEGLGGVIGDIVVTGGHFGGTNTPLISVAAGTTYRTNILVTGSQLDAGMRAPFDFAPGAPVYQRVLFSGNNIGGDVDVGTSLPPMANSIIDDQLVDARRAGVTKTTSSSGAQTIPLFTATLDDHSPYTGTECTVTVSGLVGGVGGGITRATFLFARSGGPATVTPVNAPTTSNIASGFFGVTTSVLGAVVTISATLTSATASASHLNGQIRCSGGTHVEARL